MGHYLIRRLLTAIPTLILISFAIFAILDLAPGDPTSNLPLSVPPAVRERIRESLGMNQPFAVRYVKWMRQFFVNEPLNALEKITGIKIGDSANRLRITSWSSRGKPVIDLIIERAPQTLWVVGLSYLFSVLIAVPLGVIAAVKQNSIFDQVSTVISVIGFSMPTFFTGLLAIIIFSANLHWFPSIYDTTLQVKDWSSFVQQVKQMLMPVAVLTFFQTATLSRFTAFVHVRQPDTRLCAHGAGQGISRTVCGDPACFAQQPDTGGDVDCTGCPANFRRRDHHRADFSNQRLGRPIDHSD